MTLVDNLPLSSFFTKISRRLPFLLLLIPYLIFVLCTYKDFGVAIDEPMEYGFGEMMYNRTFGRDPILLRDFAEEHENSREIWSHNHFHVMLLYMLNDDGSYEGYHLASMLFFILGLYVAFEIGLQVTKKSFLALVVPVLLVFLPRYMGDVSSNVKDPVFATYYLVGMLSIIVAPKIKHQLVRLLVVGVACGLAAAMRTVGYSLLVVFVVSSFVDAYFEKKLSVRSTFVLIAQAVLVFCAMVFVHAIEVPFVASNPILHLLKLMEVAKAFPWDGTMLYLGQQVHAGDLPWHYFFVWAGVTIPLFVIGFGTVGFFCFWNNRQIRLFSLAVFINVVLYFVMQPVIYDGIRHLLYIPVLFTVGAGLTFLQLLERVKGLMKWIFVLLLSLHVLLVGNQYFHLHPYEYVYFNEVVGYLPGAFGLFETEFWGTSYSEGARWLIKERGERGAAVVGLCGNENARKYFDGTAFRVEWIPHCDNISQFHPDYVFAFGRNDEWDKPRGEIVHEVTRQGVPLLRIFQIKNPE